MANLTYAAHDLVIAQINSGQAVLGLFTAQPTGAGVVAEPNTIYGYTRQNINFGATTRNDPTGQSTISNTNSIVFGPVVTSAWGAITYLGVFDHTGALLAYSPLATQRSPSINDTISFGAGAIQLRFN